MFFYAVGSSFRAVGCNAVFGTGILYFLDTLRVLGQELLQPSFVVGRIRGKIKIHHLVVLIAVSA